MITYHREHAKDLWAEIRPLLELHWQEIATYPDLPLDPDVERYNAMEEAGVLRCYTARQAMAGKLIGYSVVSLATNMHYRSSKIAVQDVLFLHPEHRQGTAGIGLIRFTEEQLAAEGVQAIYQHQKVQHGALGAVLSRRGYTHDENIWAKRLDKGE